VCIKIFYGKGLKLGSIAKSYVLTFIGKLIAKYFF